MKLIDDIKQFHKFLSVQATVIGGAIVAVVVADPVTASAAIGGFVSPAHIPLVTILVSVFVSLAARAKAQPSLDKKDDNNAD